LGCAVLRAKFKKYCWVPAKYKPNVDREINNEVKAFNISIS